ncbi:hypothetical protein A4X09_0g4791 [Tilletia walkeri]|uniref:Uncharacterized protein n=1 Tax=Tilletia walkeri TaxID=117179 RepID=A0A8X7N5K2_9BASI|nr:hypothetical protein A4X09_0g4791 [Tilletia walkeri]
MNAFKLAISVLLVIMSAVLGQVSPDLSTSPTPPTKGGSRQLHDRAWTDAFRGLTWKQYLAGAIGGTIGTGLSFSLVMGAMLHNLPKGPSPPGTDNPPPTRWMGMLTPSNDGAARSQDNLFDVRAGKNVEDGNTGTVTLILVPSQNDPIHSLATRAMSPEAMFATTFMAGLPIGTAFGAGISGIVLLVKHNREKQQQQGQQHRRNADVKTLFSQAM